MKNFSAPFSVDLSLWRSNSNWLASSTTRIILFQNGIPSVFFLLIKFLHFVSFLQREGGEGGGERRREIFCASPYILLTSSSSQEHVEYTSPHTQQLLHHLDTWLSSSSTNSISEWKRWLTDWLVVDDGWRWWLWWWRIFYFSFLLFFFFPWNVQFMRKFLPTINGMIERERASGSAIQDSLSMDEVSSSVGWRWRRRAK